MQGERVIWLNNEIIPVSKAKINVLAPTAQFGANVFEGIRCYWNEKEQQLYGFKLEAHYKRLKQSAKLFRLKLTYSEKQLQQALIDVVKKNSYKEDITVRQTLFVDGEGSWSAIEPIGMFVAPINKSRKNLRNEKPMSCCVSTWQRISDRCMSPRVKVGANYINSRLGQLEANGNGFDTCIFLNENGKVSEGPGSCFFMVRNGVLITPTLTSSVLESITREVIIDIARKVIGIEVKEREIDRTELYICEEAFLCGSMMEIGPIGQIDRYQIGNGETGGLTQILHKEYMNAVTGGLEQYKGCLTPIYK